MSETEKLAYLHYVAGCLRLDATPLHLFAWKRFYAEIYLKEDKPNE